MSDITLLIEDSPSAETVVKGLSGIKILSEEKTDRLYKARIRFHPLWKEHVAYCLAPEKGPSYNDKGVFYKVLEGDFPKFSELDYV